jgi:hypothetical protein
MALTEVWRQVLTLDGVTIDSSLPGTIAMLLSLGMKAPTRAS